MDKRKILEELLRGNTEPLIRAKEAERKDIEVLFAHRDKDTEEPYTDITITYRNGDSDRIEQLNKADFEKLEARLVDNHFAIVFVDYSKDCPPLYRNEEDIPET